eukprot:TRINITY_DN22112_c0_g1_i1.p1 TRINITY_DN22112_c0_g1~~TRINITY_DN22112_c0_g1_i1.p1  ORF type:complete len:595 (+),score=80.67 TRINITY_DN22112_c0_g1_i1:3-1787(+)
MIGGATTSSSADESSAPIRPHGHQPLLPGSSNAPRPPSSGSRSGSAPTRQQHQVALLMKPDFDSAAYFSHSSTDESDGEKPTPAAAAVQLGGTDSAGRTRPRQHRGQRDTHYWNVGPAERLMIEEDDTMDELMDPGFDYILQQLQHPARLLPPPLPQKPPRGSAARANATSGTSSVSTTVVTETPTVTRTVNLGTGTVTTVPTTTPTTTSTQQPPAAATNSIAQPSSVNSISGHSVQHDTTLEKENKLKQQHQADTRKSSIEQKQDDSHHHQPSQVDAIPAPPPPKQIQYHTNEHHPPPTKEMPRREPTVGSQHYANYKNSPPPPPPPGATSSPAAPSPSIPALPPIQHQSTNGKSSTPLLQEVDTSTVGRGGVGGALPMDSNSASPTSLVFVLQQHEMEARMDIQRLVKNFLEQASLVSSEMSLRVRMMRHMLSTLASCYSDALRSPSQIQQGGGSDSSRSSPRVHHHPHGGGVQFPPLPMSPVLLRTAAASPNGSSRGGGGSPAMSVASSRTVTPTFASPPPITHSPHPHSPIYISPHHQHYPPIRYQHYPLPAVATNHRYHNVASSQTSSVGGLWAAAYNQTGGLESATPK